MASGPLKRDQCEGSFNLKGCVLLMATLLDSTVLVYKNPSKHQLVRARNNTSAFFPAVASASQTVSGTKKKKKKAQKIVDA